MVESVARVCGGVLGEVSESWEGRGGEGMEYDFFHRVTANTNSSVP